jgi:lysophospholipase L1-like esterase
VRRETSVQVAARFAAEAPPRLVAGADCRAVISFGANDATLEDGRPRVPAQASVAALEDVLGRAAVLGLPAFVVGPPPANDEAQSDRIAALSARFAEACASHGTPYVAVVDELRRAGPWLAEARAGDGAHPGAGGYAQLADCVRAPFLAWLRSDRL